MFTKYFLFLFILSFIDAQYLRSASTTASCPYPRIEHGRVRLRQRAKLVKFICYPRYELVGNKYATCRDGQWDVPLPVCVRPGCPTPVIENGLMIPMHQGAWVVVFCKPSHRLTGSPVIYCDGYKWNASIPICTDTTLQSQLSCDFEDPNICGWTQDELHDFDWRRLNKKTPSSFLFTGPSFDHTYGKGGSGYYMYIESTSKLENDTARLISPIYDASLAKNGCFSFFYHMFGKAIGGLKIYQKPDSLPLQTMLDLPYIEKQRYTLFEMWGNQGDFWYSAAPKLIDYADGFQIVIEGIRGASFTSDIAIDDVAILQGDKCVAAMKYATTPAAIVPDSCTNRCDVFGVSAGELGCGCTASCVADSNCCPDFFDSCVFNAESTTISDDTPSTIANNSAELPQTQKLVYTTESTSITSTTTSTIKTTVPTPKPTTKSTPKTRPTTKPTTKQTTTTTTRKPTTRTVTTKKITRPTTTTLRTTRKVTTTSSPFGISRTIDNHNSYHEMIEKAKKEQMIESRGHAKPSESHALKTAMITIVALACLAGVAWLVMFARGARGKETLARLRGRTLRDPEVRFLSADVDE